MTIQQINNAVSHSGNLKLLAGRSGTEYADGANITAFPGICPTLRTAGSRMASVNAAAAALWFAPPSSTHAYLWPGPAGGIPPVEASP